MLINPIEFKVSRHHVAYALEALREAHKRVAAQAAKPGAREATKTRADALEMALLTFEDVLTAADRKRVAG